MASGACDELRRQLDEANLARIHLESDLRMRAHDVKEAANEVRRLNDLVDTLQLQHREKVQQLTSEKEKGQKRLQKAGEDALEYRSRWEVAQDELETSLQGNERLTALVQRVMKEKEEQLYMIHKAEDEAFEYQTKFENLQAQRQQDQEEVDALRSSLEYNEQYVKTIAQLRDRLEEKTRRQASQIQALAVRCAREGDDQATSSGQDLRDFASFQHEHQQHGLQQHQQQQQQLVASQHAGAGQSWDNPPHQHDWLAAGWPGGAPQQHPPFYPADPPPVQYVEPQGPPPYYTTPPRHAEDGHEDVFFVEDPMSPQMAAVLDKHEAEREAFEGALDRMGKKLSKLHADVAASRVEDRFVQKQYIVEASTKLNGSLAAVDTLCASIGDWRASISCGRQPWGDLQSLDDVLAARRLKDVERRATMKMEVRRTLEQAGMAGDTVALLELFFAAGRVRDSVTYAFEAFTAAKEAADACMAAAKRTIDESLAAAQAQATSMHAAQSDAGQMDTRLRELTAAKFEAEQQALSLKRQVEERESYQREVERLAQKMKDEAQEERKKMSQLAMEMTEKQKKELLAMSAHQKAELEAMSQAQTEQVSKLHETHTAEIARLSAEAQSLKDTIQNLEAALEDNNRQLDVAKAKKKSHRNAKEELTGEVRGLKEALLISRADAKDRGDRLKRIESENMVLRELCAKLESDVRRGRIVAEGEVERNAFAAWKQSMAVPAGQNSSFAGMGSQARSRTHYAAHTPPLHTSVRHVSIDRSVDRRPSLDRRPLRPSILRPAPPG
ncbi:hypothetical protein DIPPA_00289 [Diplonema papillatum]|nr:hypothetical protein DIPPA_00289 [Diplonema papillatum]